MRISSYLAVDPIAVWLPVAEGRDVAQVMEGARVLGVSVSPARRRPPAA